MNVVAHRITPRHGRAAMRASAMMCALALSVTQPAASFSNASWCTCSGAGMDTVGAETVAVPAAFSALEAEAQCARASSRRAIVSKPPQIARAVACAHAGRAAAPGDTWFDFVEGNALEIMGERNKGKLSTS